jgi:hypothetical protein
MEQAASNVSAAYRNDVSNLAIKKTKGTRWPFLAPGAPWLTTPRGATPILFPKVTINSPHKNFHP